MGLGFQLGYVGGLGACGLVLFGVILTLLFLLNDLLLDVELRDLKLLIDILLMAFWQVEVVIIVVLTLGLEFVFLIISLV